MGMSGRRSKRARAFRESPESDPLARRGRAESPDTGPTAHVAVSSSRAKRRAFGNTALFIGTELTSVRFSRARSLRICPGGHLEKKIAAEFLNYDRSIVPTNSVRNVICEIAGDRFFG